MTTHLPRLTRARAARLFADESGAATAEYAIATMAIVEHRWHVSRMRRIWPQVGRRAIRGVVQL